MLVLSRYPGEIIKIGDHITIQIMEVRSHDKVRVGIDAPPEVPVHREEVYDAIQRETNGGAGDETACAT